MKEQKLEMYIHIQQQTDNINNTMITQLQQQVQQEKEKNEIQQAVLNDLLVRVTALERK
jgi:hypothetical protein